MRLSVVVLIGACVIACRQPQSTSAPIALQRSDVQALSLLGDSLRTPALDASVEERLAADLQSALRAYEADRSSPDALIWVGRRQAYLGRYRDAIATFGEGIRLHPNDPRMYRHRGHRFITLRRFDDAIRDFEMAAQLMAGRPDEVEPDGQPNARNVPVGSLQSNVWYHLALAHYLKGDWDAAARAARAGIDVSTNPDRLVSQTHWLYMAHRRAGRDNDARLALEPIRDDFDVIENHSYYRLVKLYRDGMSRAAVDSAIGAPGAATPSDASLAYGFANWLLYTGDTARAVEAFERIRSGGSWASFGFIAAEADLARIRRGR